MVPGLTLVFTFPNWVPVLSVGSGSGGSWLVIAAPILESVPLSYDALPTIPNPFRRKRTPEPVATLNNQLAPLNTTGVAGTAGFVGAQNLMPLDARYRTLFPTDFSGQAASTEQANKQRQTTNQNTVRQS